MTDWFIRSEQPDNRLTVAGQALDGALMGVSGRTVMPQLKVDDDECSVPNKGQYVPEIKKNLLS